jgi:integrase
MKLTQKTVESLTLPEGKAEAIFFDEEIAGFGCRLRSGGSRVWIFQFKQGNKQRRMTLGSFPAIRSEPARQIAEKLHAKVRLGQDPAGEKLEGRARAAETLEAMLRAYLPHAKTRQRPRTLKETERHLLVYCRPLHGLQITKIDRRTIAARLGEIAATSGAVTSNRVRASLSAFFAWCLRRGLLDSNPVVGTGREEEKSRDRVLADAELRAIWCALEDNDYGAIIKLLVITGQRAGEIAGLHLSEVREDEIALPAERVKNARAHRVPLTGLAREILDSQSRRLGRDFVFGRGEGGFSGWSKAKRLLDDRIREMTGSALAQWTPHDLRRTAATGMADLGVAPHVIEAVLNHKSGTIKGVAATYNRYEYSTEKRAALNLWANHVVTIVEGRESKIVPLARGA